MSNRKGVTRLFERSCKTNSSPASRQGSATSRLCGSLSVRRRYQRLACRRNQYRRRQGALAMEHQSYGLLPSALLRIQQGQSCPAPWRSRCRDRNWATSMFVSLSKTSWSMLMCCRIVQRSLPTWRPAMIDYSRPCKPVAWKWDTFASILIVTARTALFIRIPRQSRGGLGSRSSDSPNLCGIRPIGPEGLTGCTAAC